ncbi:MAG: D-alanine--D-alanine ligase A, partial [Candidatus Berkiella sp.]
PIASCVGEIKPTHAFYSYEAKYLDPDGAKLIIPAGLQSAIAERVRQLAIQSFSVAECKGLARVDFFLSPENDIYVNELNTMPGFTSISMYPKLWEASGISYQDLISKLINFAVEEFLVKQQLHLTPNIAQQSALVASK